MISYRDYQLPQSTIDYLKEKNARQSIAKYIEEHGEEPSDINQFFVVNPGEIEQYKRVSYAKLLTCGKVPENNQQDEEENMIDVFMNFSVVDDTNILSKDSNILGEGNYQYEYIKIVIYENCIPHEHAYAEGVFSSLADVKNTSIRLNISNKYAFFVYLIKSDEPINYNIINYTNEFYYSNLSKTVVDRNIHNEIIQREHYKEYIGGFCYYTPELNKSVSLSVYTFNPKGIIIFSNFKNDGKYITVFLSNHDDTKHVDFWYENDNICTTGNGILTKISTAEEDSSIGETANSVAYKYKYVFDKYECSQILDTITPMGFLTYRFSFEENYTFEDSTLANSGMNIDRSVYESLYYVEGTPCGSPCRFVVSKEGYLSYIYANNACDVFHRNSENHKDNLSPLIVPNELESEVDQGIDVNIIDD